MFMPGTLQPGDEPLWLTLQPSWRQMIVEFNAQNHIDILDRIQTFGERFKYDEAHYVDNGVFFPSHEVYWHNEPLNEEGWATENQVRPCCKTIYNLFAEKHRASRAVELIILLSDILYSILEVFSSHFPLQVWPHCPL